MMNHLLEEFTPSGRFSPNRRHFRLRGPPTSFEEFERCLECAIREHDIDHEQGLLWSTKTAFWGGRCDDDFGNFKCCFQANYRFRLFSESFEDAIESVIMMCGYPTQWPTTLPLTTSRSLMEYTVFDNVIPTHHLLDIFKANRQANPERSITFYSWAATVEQALALTTMPQPISLRIVLYKSIPLSLIQQFLRAIAQRSTPFGHLSLHGVSDQREAALIRTFARQLKERRSEEALLETLELFLTRLDAAVLTELMSCPAVKGLLLHSTRCYNFHLTRRTMMDIVATGRTLRRFEWTNGHPTNNTFDCLAFMNALQSPQCALTDIGVDSEPWNEAVGEALIQALRCNQRIRRITLLTLDKKWMNALADCMENEHLNHLQQIALYTEAIPDILEACKRLFRVNPHLRIVSQHRPYGANRMLQFVLYHQKIVQERFPQGEDDHVLAILLTNQKTPVRIGLVLSHHCDWVVRGLSNGFCTRMRKMNPS